jgi:glycosyltransferase involved in cell wall biosynthesis
MPTKNLVCFVSPNLAKSAENPQEIISRIKLYAKNFEELNGVANSTTLMVTSGLNTENFPDNSVGGRLVITNFGEKGIKLWSFAIKTYKVLKIQLGQKITLVAGDNYGALLICLLLKKFLRADVSIQISIHGNPLLHGSSTLRSLARKFSFHFFVPRASIIRLVSKHLEQPLGRYFGSSARVIVCPIPITVGPFPKFQPKKGLIGIVGRLHYERGVDELCEILTCFAKNPDSFSFTVIGGGPQKEMLERLKNSNEDLRLELLGALSHDQVLDHYPDFNLLLSCAPDEGYGLALREAILSGVPVVARRNLGTLELQKVFPNMIFLFDSTQEAVNLIRAKCGILIDPELIELYRRKQEDFDTSNIATLVKSWS